MSKTIITCDSGMDPINTDYMVSALLNRNDAKTYRDVTEITSEEVLAEIKNGFSFKTSAATPKDYYNLFNRALDNCDNIIHLSMGEGLSRASLNTAFFVSQEIARDKITVLDAKNGATGGTLILEYAKYLENYGLSYREILEELQRYLSDIKTSFFVPNPTGFKRSGRDSSELCMKDKAVIIGSKALTLAGVKFRVDFNSEGQLYASKMMRGKSEVKALEMIKSIVNDDTINEYDRRMAVIGTVAENRVSMNDINAYLTNYFDTVIRKDINAVVAAYGSPDLVGLSLARKR